MKKTSNIFVFLILLLALLFTSNSAFAIKEWTIMSYLDADNDLEEYLLADFVEMGAVGSTDQVNIVAQVDRVSGYTTAYGNWTNTRRFYIKKGDTPSSTPLEQLGELNMGDKNTLRDFIIWAVTNYPAKKYMLILSNHGGGWRKRNMQGKVTKAICWDETNNDDCLYMKDVQIAMKDAENATGKKITVIGFDACLMAMIEVATDMKDCADVMIASEEVEPGNGWPYTPVLTKLTTTPTMTGGQLASIIVDEYALSYKGIDSTITLSAVDLTKISALNTSIKTFVDNANQWTKIKDARLATRTYSEADGYPHADLGHFMSLLSSKGVTDPAVLSAAAAVRNNLTAAVFANKYGSSRTNSNGLAIFFPKTTTAYTNAQGSAYPTKDFNLATGWDSFLKKYFNPPADKPISDLSGAAAVDGSGVATLSRTTPVPVNTSLSSVTLTFTAQEDLSGGQVRITIPSTWTAPALSGAGTIALTKGTGVSATFTISGYQILVNTTTLPKNAYFKIAYKYSKSPANSEVSIFKVESRSKTGTFKEITNSPYLLVGNATKSIARSSKKSRSNVKVNINTASVEEIVNAKLYKIGRATAEKIVAYRKANGLFRDKNDLLKVKGIGKATLKKNENRIIIE